MASNAIDSTNPYSAPATSLAVEESTYSPSIFSTQGRVGRLRYIAYHSWVSFLTVLGYGVLAAIIAGVLSKTGSGMDQNLMILLVGPLYIVVFAVYFIYTKRRLNDLNRSGWLSLIGMIPLINILFSLYVLFAPGSKEANDYGPAPAANPRFLWTIVLIPIFIGVLAALAVPTFQQYAERAKQAQSMSTENYSSGDDASEGAEMDSSAEESSEAEAP